ncbi:MAG: Tetratricopeptide 4 [Acidobacteria bacterium]|nr:Tetratricopeptide 4 [Acidobacteriota bacterium]
MLQPATSSAVIGDFSRTSVVLHGNRFELRSANGEFFIAESFLTGRRQEHRVEYTLGSRRVQHYLATIDKGRIVVLPPSWDVQRQAWFDNMDIVRPGQTAGTPVQQWNKDCVGCHVSGEEKNYRPESQEYRTQWTDFGTSCERCHGPGSAHVDAYVRSRATRPAGERLIVKPTRLDPTISSMICAQCHSLRNVINPGYKAGDDYFDFFMPRLEYDPGTDRELPYWPDGRPRRFSNDAIGLWQSACYRQGGATCTTCHETPHEPNVDRHPQLGSGNNALCSQCHRAIGQQLSAHTRHTADSVGSACVECHMPKTVISLNATMRDHTISVPAPENTVTFGIPNACTACHTDRKPAWAVDVLKTWWPNGKRARLVNRAQAFSAARQHAPSALEPLLGIAADVGGGPLIQATAVGYLRFYRQPEAQTALLVAAQAADPALRAAAIASLGDAGGGGSPGAVRSALVAALSDRHRAVRIAALVSLINARGSALAPADADRLQSVGREFAALLPLYADDPGFDRDLGLVHFVGADFDRAAEMLQLAFRLDPRGPSTGFLLALARLGQGRISEARALLEQVPASDPSYAPAQKRLKQLIRP